VRDETPAVGDDRAAVVPLNDHGGLVGRCDVEVAALVGGQVFRIEDLGQL
jgi:hypothetical protein